MPSSDTEAVAVSIVVPVRNEADNVAPLIAEIAIPSRAREDRAVSDLIKNEVRALIVAGARPG